MLRRGSRDERHGTRAGTCQAGTCATNKKNAAVVRRCEALFKKCTEAKVLRHVVGLDAWAPFSPFEPHGEQGSRRWRRGGVGRESVTTVIESCQEKARTLEP